MSSCLLLFHRRLALVLETFRKQSQALLMRIRELYIFYNLYKFNRTPLSSEELMNYYLHLQRKESKRIIALPR